MTILICGIFFLSGASALIFETLWFHQAGLVFGNGVWASSLVLASFMAGLALGNAAAARFGARIASPVRLYAGIEILIAVTGVGLVFGLPHLLPVLAPVLGPLLDQPWLANPLRLLAGFVLLLVPSTAMGATLPILVNALLSRDPHFGSVLGRLYGWNTLGAVAGAVAAEATLIEHFGVRGSAGFAAALNLLVAVAGLAVSDRFSRAVKASTSAPVPVDPPTRRVRAWLAAAFLSGFTLLALEVVWFRFLQLWVHGSSLVFSIMLAVVLAGIALGSLTGGFVLRRFPEAWRATPWVSLLAAFAVGALYRAYGLFPTPSQYVVGWPELLVYGGTLMGPVAYLSGLVFTWIGTAIEREVAPPTRAAGWMTFWNTIGSGFGPLVAGFVLLPLLGMERSFLVLSGVYGVVALLACVGLGMRIREPRRALVAVACAVMLVAAFPLGRMEQDYVPRSAERLVKRSGSDIELIQEGRTETVVLIKRGLLGQPVSRILITNGHAMTGDAYGARRYMNQYVYLPVAFHPEPKRALLISYGLGNTARALLDTESLEHVDVVDISQEILGLADRVFGSRRNPLRDDRVDVHVEDGRYFLEMTEERYDLITGEPPPPKNAGVVNLYTREYFQLVYDRLAEGGIHSYWLPVHEMYESDARTIVSAYCEVFTDCTLWVGGAMDWMLMGSRGAEWRADEERFGRQWEDPSLARELKSIGFEEPAQLAATFLMDPTQLKALADEAAPLVDDWPKRMSDDTPLNRDAWQTWSPWLEEDGVRARFEASSWLRGALSGSVYARALELLPYQRVANAHMAPAAARVRSWAERMRDVRDVLAGSSFETLALWDLGASSRALEIAESLPQRSLRQLQIRASAALARREYDAAVELFRQLEVELPSDARNFQLRVLALCLADRLEDARRAIASRVGRVRDTQQDRAFWNFLDADYAVGTPFSR